MVCRYEKEEKTMKGFSIKDKCQKCGGTYDLDGVVCPKILISGELLLETATLCAVCREGFDKYLEQHVKEGVKHEKENHN